MKKYLLFAIKNGNIDAVLFLSEYYEEVEKNYELSEKYLNMIIEKEEHEKEEEEQEKEKEKVKVKTKSKQKIQIKKVFLSSIPEVESY